MYRIYARVQLRHRHINGQVDVQLPEISPTGGPVSVTDIDSCRVWWPSSEEIDHGGTTYTTNQCEPRTP